MSRPDLLIVRLGAIMRGADHRPHAYHACSGIQRLVLTIEA